MIASCSSPSTAPEVRPFDTTGYIVEDHDRDLQLLTKLDASGEIAERVWLHEAVPSGSWTLWESGRLKQISTYVAGRLTGETIIYDHRGFVNEKRMYLDGEYHGLVATFHRGRPVTAARYKRGVLHGRSEVYFKEGKETGRLQQTIMYKDGKKDGPMRYYNPAGAVTTEYQYANDEVVSGGVK